MGNQSPLVNSVGGPVNIIDERSDINEIRNIVDIIDKTTPEGTKYTLQEFRTRISKIYQQLYDVLPQEAEDRATQFLSTLPMRQQALEDKYEDRIKLIEILPSNLQETFNYIIKYTDLYLSELEKRSNITFEKLAEIGPIFASNTNGYVIRRIKCEDKKYIDVNFYPGLILKNEVSEYPKLLFIGFFANGDGIRDGELKIIKPTGSGFGGGWLVSFERDGTMNNETRKRFKQEFDMLLDRVIAAKS
jgi:hypothetical protein